MVVTVYESALINDEFIGKGINSYIDRLLVSTSIFEEGGLFRYSEIDLNYRIRVKDIVITYDLENDGEEENRMETLHDYTVDNNGFFIKI